MCRSIRKRMLLICLYCNSQELVLIKDASQDSERQIQISKFLSVLQNSRSNHRGHGNGIFMCEIPFHFNSCCCGGWMAFVRLSLNSAGEELSWSPCLAACLSLCIVRLNKSILFPLFTCHLLSDPLGTVYFTFNGCLMMFSFADSLLVIAPRRRSFPASITIKSCSANRMLDELA